MRCPLCAVTIARVHPLELLARLRCTSLMGYDGVGGFGNATFADEVDAVSDHDVVTGCGFAAERATCRCFLRRFTLFRFTLARCTARGEVCLIAAASLEHTPVSSEVETVDDGARGLS